MTLFYISLVINLASPLFKKKRIHSGHGLIGFLKYHLLTGSCFVIKIYGLNKVPDFEQMYNTTPMPTCIIEQC